MASYQQGVNLPSNGSSNFLEGIGNSFTGNKDWEREQIAAQQQREYNSAEAQKNRDFQMEMSNSAYQRGAADLKKAGYNPALVTGGAGASSPSGNSASSSKASGGHVDGVGAVLKILNSATAFAKSIK